MTIVLGLTGGIASGKSTADDFFRQKHIPIIDSDQISHTILDPQEAGYQPVVAHFGTYILAADLTIDRTKLGQVVFHDQEELAALNRITHPLIFQAIQAKITRYRTAQAELVIFDAPLLFETNGQKYCDQTLLLALPQKIQVTRLMKRDHLTKAEAWARINSQMPLSQKSPLADYVIDNTGSKEDLTNKLEQVLKQLKKEDKHGMS